MLSAHASVFLSFFLSERAKTYNPPGGGYSLDRSEGHLSLGNDNSACRKGCGEALSLDSPMAGECHVLGAPVPHREGGKVLAETAGSLTGVACLSTSRCDGWSEEPLHGELSLILADSWYSYVSCRHSRCIVTLLGLMCALGAKPRLKVVRARSHPHVSQKGGGVVVSKVGGRWVSG